MAIDKYIWLGDADPVNPSGNLIFDSLLAGEGHHGWKVWPLLRWQQDDSGHDGTLSLAALIQVNDAHPLEQILLWLGTKGKGYTESVDSPEWRVIHFNDTEKSLGDWGIHFSEPHGQGDFVAVRDVDKEIALDGHLKNIPFISIAGGSKYVVNSEGVAMELDLTARIPSLFRDANDEFIENHGVKLTFHFAADDAKLTVNGKELAVEVDNGVYSIQLGAPGSPWLVAYKEGDAWKAAFEIPLPEATTKHQLLSNFPAEVEFTWKKSAIRLDHDGIAIVVPPPDEHEDEYGPVIAVAVFRLPLIQSGGQDPLSNAVAQLVTSKVGNIPNVLEYKFELFRDDANELLEKAVALVRHAWDYGNSRFNEPALMKDALSKMRALLDRFLEKGEPGEEEAKAAELRSFVGRLTDLTGSAADKLAVKLGDAKEFIDIAQERINELLDEKEKLKDYPIPLALTVEHGDQMLVFFVVLRMNLWTGRLSDDRAYFYIAKPKIDENSSGELDLGILHLTLPPREEFGEVPDHKDHDGYLDFRNHDVVLSPTFSSEDGPPSNDQTPVTVLFPGGLKTNSKKDTRLRLVLNPFDPDTWPDAEEPRDGDNPNPNPKRLQLRLGNRGVTLYATADTTRGANIPLDDSAQSGPDLPLRLQEERQGLKSEIVIINNQIRYATLFGTLGVPGLDNYEADVQLALRQTSEDKMPTVVAEVDLQTSDQSSLARLRTPWLQAQLDDLRMRLEWDDGKWKVDAWASGALSLTPRITSVGGIEGLDAPRAIPFRDLSLTDLHKPKNGGITLASGESPARFELLDGLFRVDFHETKFDYDLERRSASMTVQRARFQFEKKGDVDVAVDVGGFSLGFQDGRLKMELASSLGVSLKIKDAVRFRGEISWNDSPTERYLAAGGNLALSGFPEVAGMLKIGTGRKQNGKMAPNIAIYGAFDYEAEFFAGVTLKRIGVGLGVNNRLRALGAEPRPEEIIQKLDQLTPDIPSAWSFVTQDGLYVSIVATALIGSNRGTDRTINAYLASLLMTIDTNLDIVAAGRFWLFSSPRFITRADHASRPVLVGVMALRPREKTLSFVAETRPRPAIEANSQLQTILSKARARYSFFLSPQMADSYLEELSFADNFLGVSMEFFASYRLAIGKFGALMRSSQAIRGAYSNSLSAGVGGFSFSGTLGLDVEYGGLISQSGLAAYGMIDARVSFTVSAFINMPTPALETRRFEKTISISLTIPYLRCRRWRCRWRTRTINESWTVVVEVPVPVVVMKRYESGPQHLALRMRGAIAFDERGSIGFLGELSISTRIAGFKLSISPSLRFNHRIVDQVRKRVAAVENHLNDLRGISPPALPDPADSSSEATPSSVPGPKQWLHYTSRRANGVFHVLVPSPDNPDAWYTPESHAVGEYSNLPLEYDQASEAERKHRSPFRNAVMRMQLTFNDGNGEKKIVDLTMPWDRLNMDALPPDEPEGNETPPTNEERVALLMRLSEMEAVFLNTAAERLPEPVGPTDEERPTCIQCLPQKLADVTVVSDPRIESNARQFWTLQDQRIRPDYAPPAVFRPVEELVSEGFAGAAKQGDIGRLLLFDRLERRAARWARHENIDPTEQERLTQARGGVVSRILDDLQREDGPQQFGVISEIQVERRSLVARRRAPIFVKKPENDSGDNEFKFTLTRDVLLNSTDLDLQGSEPFRLTIDWGDGVSTNVSFDPQALENDSIQAFVVEEESTDDVDHKYRADNAALRQRFYITVTRDGASNSGISSPCLADVILVELVNQDVERHVGLIFKQEEKDWKLESAKIIRFGDGEPVDSDKPEEDQNSGSPVKDFVQEDDVELVSVSVDKPKQAIEQIHDWLDCLPACQQYLGLTNPGAAAAFPEQAAPSSPPRSRIRVSLPVKFHEDLLRNHLPELNRFQIFRQFPWESAPVLVDDRAFPQMQDIQDQGAWYRLIDSFLYTEDFELDQQRRLVIDRLQPETSVIRYWLRAVPYGGITQDNENTARLPMIAWPPVRLFVPPEIPSLPDLAIVMSVKSLRYPSGSPSEEPLELRLVDRQGQQIAWGDVAPGQPQPPGLEIWAEQRDLIPSGFYIGDDLGPGEGREQAAHGDEILRQRSQLAAEQLPRSTEGRKFLLKTIQANEAGPYLVSYRKFAPGYAYRLFVRLAIPAEDLLLTPVPLALMRRLSPEPLQPNTPMRLVDTVEFIDDIDWKRILDPETPTTWLSSGQFDATPLTESPSVVGFPGIRLGWSSLDTDSKSFQQAPDGGVEILLQDFDESHRLDRMVVEVQDEMPFQQGHRDFRDASAWRVHAEICKRVAQADNDAFDLEFVEAVPLDQYYLWQHERNPALERMDRAFTELIGKDDSSKGVLARYAAETDSASWKDLHNALTYWFAAVFDYQRTPLALRDADEQRLADAMVLCAVQMFQGTKVLEDDGAEVDEDPKVDVALLLSSLERRESQLREVLDEIARSDPRGKQIQDREDEYERLKWQLRDFDTADRLSKIILRRRTYAEELFQPEDGGIENAPEPAAGGDGHLPRADAWDHLVGLYKGWTESGELDEEEEQQVRYAFPLTSRLLALVEVDQPEAGSTAAGQLELLVRNFWTKVSAVRNRDNQDGTAYPERLAYRKRLASLVPQAAGLTAALNTLKRDLGDRNWTLLLRPHHQLLSAEATGDDADGRHALPVKLADLMPDCFRTAAQAGTAADQDFSGSVVALLNLFERFGFAVDFAITDDLQRFLSQKELLQYLQGFQWQEILASADPEDGAGHEILVCVGREPDTKPEVFANRALGYGFLKIAVVPKGFWSLLSSTEVPVDISSPNRDDDDRFTAELGSNGNRDHLSSIGFTNDDTIKATFGEVVIEFTLNQLRDSNLEIPKFTENVLPAGEGTIDCWPVVERRLRKWFALRAIETDEAEEQRQSQFQALVELAKYVRTIMDRSPHSEQGSGSPAIHYILLEQRFERWVTVPALGRRSHIAWTAPHRYGQRYQVAMRRISRYEPLVHWYLGQQTPAISRIPKHVLGGPTVDLERCQPLSPDERATRPVQIQPHPQRVQFIYGLPDSGSRSLLSRLSSVRTGYRGIETSFAYKLFDQEGFEDHLQHLGIDFVTATVDTETPLAVKIDQTDPHPSSLNILLKKDGKTWEAARVKLEDSAGKWNVKFGSETLDLSIGETVILTHLHVENEQSPYFAVWASTNDSGEMVRLKQQGRDRTAKPLELASAENAYQGMFAEFYDHVSSEGLRHITAYDPADRSITLNRSAPENANKVRIWRLEPLVHRESIPMGGEPPARLFRHERLVALNELPYFFEYRLRADALFDSRIDGQAQSTNGSNTTVTEAWARRRPSALGVRRASIRGVEGTYEFTVFLSRLEDHLTDREVRRLKQDFDSEEGDLSIAGDDLPGPIANWGRVRAEQLPDLAMAYRILWKVIIEESESGTLDGGDRENADPFYVPAVDVVLPQNANWTEQDEDEAEASVLIVSRSPREVKIVDGQNLVEQFFTKIRVNRWSPAASPVYSVTFRVKIEMNPDQTPVFAFPTNQNRPPIVFLQASRDGVLSRLLPLEVLP